MLTNNITRKSAVVLGNFDGLHIGHREIIKVAENVSADEFMPCVLLFNSHSDKVLTGNIPPRLIDDVEREKFFKEHSFNIEYIDFEHIKDMTPQQFVEEILIKKLNAGAIICGYNYHFGKDAQGTAETMRTLCEKFGLKCEIVGKVEYDNVAVSSTYIRQLLQNGKIEQANKLLGREFSFTSEVIEGNKRGRIWGIRTANQRIPMHFVVPKFGVYESRVTVDGEEFKSITNIGIRPTVGTDIVLSETHILNFNRDIYGKKITVSLIKFIRPEIKFNSFDELKKQMEKDIRELDFRR